MNDRDDDAAALDDARALLGAFVENGWSHATIRANGRAFALSRDAALGGLGAGVENSASAAAPVTVTESVSAPHVGTVTGLAAVGAVIAVGETVATLSVLDEVVDITAPCGGRILSHGAEKGAMVEFGQMLIELAR